MKENNAALFLFSFSYSYSRLCEHAIKHNKTQKRSLFVTGALFVKQLSVNTGIQHNEAFFMRLFPSQPHTHPSQSNTP